MIYFPFGILLSLLIVLLALKEIKASEFTIQAKEYSTLGIKDLKWSSNGRYLLSLRHKSLNLWDLENTKLYRIYEGREALLIKSMDISSDNKYIALVKNRKIEIVDIERKEVKKEIKDLDKYDNICIHISYSPDGKYLACPVWNNHCVYIIDVKSGKTVKIFKKVPPKNGYSTAHPYFSTWSPDSNNIAVIYTDHTVRIFSIRTKKSEKILNDKKRNFISLSYSPDGKNIASGDENGNLKIWDTNSGKLLKTKKERSWVKFVKWSSDGKYIIYVVENKIKIFDVNAGKIKKIIEYPNTTITLMAIHPSSKFVAVGSNSGILNIWNVDTGKLSYSLVSGENGYIIFLPDGYFFGEGEYKNYINCVETNNIYNHYDFDYCEDLYKPNLLKTLLKNLSIKTVDKKVIKTNKEKEIKSKNKSPLSLKIISPTQEKVETEDANININYCVEFNDEYSIDITVNREIYNNRSILRKNNLKKACYVENIPLKVGENKISISLKNKNSILISKNLKVYRKPITTEEINKPNLYILSIGVSKYGIEYADEDAKAIVKLFQSLERKIFRKVEYKLLTNEKATVRNVRKAITWLVNKPTQNDVVIFFLAGHGERDSIGDYYFIAWDTNQNNISATGLSGYEIEKIIRGINAKKILFLDTCKSGINNNFTNRSLSGYRDFLNKLKVSNNGSVIFSASRGNGFAVEKTTWGHGALTKAIIDGLRYRGADYNGDNIITVEELSIFIKEKVKKLTDGYQKPETIVPERELPDFPIWTY